jgi:hypothetical protein
MARYYVDVQIGDTLHTDENGSDLPDVQAAQKEAVGALFEIAKFNANSRGGMSFSTSVRGGNGHVIYRATLAFSEEWKSYGPLVKRIGRPNNY